MQPTLSAADRSVLIERNSIASTDLPQARTEMPRGRYVACSVRARWARTSISRADCGAPGSRADVFMAVNGPIVCEIDTDTPSGEAEAMLLDRVALRGDGLVDPNASFEERFTAMIEGVPAAARSGSATRRI